MNATGETLAIVLIVEDEGAIAETLSYIVTDCGYLPVIVQNGNQALVCIQQHMPGLIITDWLMPQMNGVELIAAVHARYDPQDAAPPIVLMSAVDMHQVHHSNADAVLSKPFAVVQVESLLQHYLAPGSDDNNDHDVR